MSKTLKVAFSDFWGDFDPEDNFFYHCLKMRYDVKAHYDEDADLVIFSTFGDNHKKYKCKKIHFTGEPIKAPEDTYDYAFGFAEDAKTYRLPLWVLYINWFNAPYPSLSGSSPHFLIQPQSLFTPRTSVANRFCSFVFNNPTAERVRFLDQLNRYRSVDCGGTLGNTSLPLRGDEHTKLRFLRDRKFSIAFESKDQTGYVTEKLLHALIAPSVPIYWGTDMVSQDFNPASFIDARGQSLDALSDYVAYVDNCDQTYNAYMNASIFRDNKINTNLLPYAIAQKLQEIIG